MLGFGALFGLVPLIRCYWLVVAAFVFGFCCSRIDVIVVGISQFAPAPTLVPALLLCGRFAPLRCFCLVGCSDVVAAALLLQLLFVITKASIS